MKERGGIKGERKKTKRADGKIQERNRESTKKGEKYQPWP
jgi:hypothetical protein